MVEPVAATPPAAGATYASSTGDFVRGLDLHNRLWYPTVFLTHRMVRTGTDVVIVAGGSISTDYGNVPNPTWNLYEAFNIPGRVNIPLQAPTYDQPYGSTVPTLPGPQFFIFFDSFFEYPRLHLLSTGHMFMSGYHASSAKFDHDNVPPAPMTSGHWNHFAGAPSANPPSPPQRVYGSSFRHPNVGGIQDLIVRLGGEDLNTGFLTDSMEMCDANPPAPGTSSWVSMPPMKTHKDQCNAVILPDASWIVFGGRTQDTHGSTITDELVPYRFVGGQWQDLDLAASPRTYHSTAVLLPDGTVLVGGGNSRSSDYEVFTPPYLCPAAALNRPTNVALSVALDQTDSSYHLSYNTQFSVTCTLPLGSYLNKIVLMAPGSDTHHSDMSQRYVELTRITDPEFMPPPNEIHVQTPLNSKLAPRGFYMLFVMDGNGIPSVAKWVKLE